MHSTDLEYRADLPAPASATLFQIPTCQVYCTHNVPTKTHDGGAKAANDCESAAKSSTNRPRPQPVRKHQYPFLYYSDQETRMNALLLSSGEKMRESSESVKLFDRCTYLSPLVSSTLDLVVILDHSLAGQAVATGEAQTRSSSSALGTLWRLANRSRRCSRARHSSLSLHESST